MDNPTRQSSCAPVRIGILTVSDRVFRDEYPDQGGPAIRRFLTQVIASPWEAIERIVPDEQPLIEKTLVQLCDIQACCLIMTTGGTGPAPRDVTPDATMAVCQKLLPGFGELMRAVSWATVPTAILSRQIAGIRAKTLIINLPGRPRAVSECLNAVFPAVPDCLDLLNGPRLQIHKDQLQRPAFRHDDHFTA